jgi:NO-binding membrane sensor protein with MHYT domain
MAALGIAVAATYEPVISIVGAVIAIVAAVWAIDRAKSTLRSLLP